MIPDTGARLGPYEIVAQIGRGGMGEVWRATDSRLDRQVALKLLPDGFADDPERHARFEREAKVLASLNHPNIATLFGLEHLDGRHVLVMELVEGEGLDERIARGPVPVDEAIPIALQIAEALEAAHEAGIVHRDLKPANIRIRSDGAVKVLDFGLAKTWEADGDDSGLTHSPTITRHHTRAGVLLGTAAYMSPEQARGRPVDRRADIWAFGVVLWEMLTGRQLFAGETVSDVLAAVLTRDPDLDTLPPVVGRQLRNALAGCLTRDPKRRWRSAADVGVLLSTPDETASTPPVAQARPRRGAVLTIAAAAALGGFAIAASLLGGFSPSDSAAAPTRRLSIVEPELAPSSAVSFSPDGAVVAYTVERDGVSRVALRSLDRFEAELVGGTEGGFNPFFSPDGRWVGFFTREQLLKIPVEGGSPRTVCELRGRVRLDVWDAGSWPTGVWGSDGMITFSSGFWRAPTAAVGLFRVAAAGGEPTPLTRIVPDDEEQGHWDPRLTPDEKRITFTVRNAGVGRIEAVDPLSGERSPVVDGYSNAVVLPTGVLLVTDSFYTRLVAFRLDLDRLQVRGEPVPVVDGLSANPANGFTVSRQGSLLYLHGATGEGDNRLTRISSDGSTQKLPLRAGNWLQPRVSPDGSNVAVRELSDSCTIWLLDRQRGILARLTETGSDNHNPVWSSDGRFVTFGREVAGGSREIYWQRADGGRPAEQLTEGAAGPRFPTSWSADGRWLLFDEQSPETDVDVWVLDRVNDRVEPVIRSGAQELGAMFSPDGRLIAYVSDESGHSEVYLRGWPEAGLRVQVSDGGGAAPFWSRRDGVLHYVSGQRVMAVEVSAADPPRISAPREALHLELAGEGWRNIDALPGGAGFVAAQPAATGAHELRVTLGFADELAHTVMGSGGGG